MSADSQPIDAYSVVLADLRAKRAQIDQAIQAIEALSGSPTAQPRPAPDVAIDASIDTPGAFLGMTIADAAKKLLAARRKVTGNVEMAAAFKAGGLALNSVDPVNTIGAVLSRRATNIGDIVKMGRGQWGLAEWYPGRNFKKKPAKGDLSPEAGSGDTLEEKVAAHRDAAAGPKRMIDLSEGDEVEDVWSPLREGVFK